MDGGAGKAAVHGFAEGWTLLSDFTFTFHFHALEKDMATHSSVLAWRIPGTGEPAGLLSMGSHRVGHDWSNLAAAANNKLVKKKKFFFKWMTVFPSIYPLYFPGGASGKEATWKCRSHNRYGFDPWHGKIPWRRARQPTLEFLPGESHGQRSVVDYTP